MALLRVATLIAATLTIGLVAGLFYAYACSVMPGLGRTDDRTFVSAMRHINEAILNGWFAVIFVGAPLLTAVAAILHLRADGRSVLPWIAAAFVLCAVMLVITFGANIPLNNALASAGDLGDVTALAAIRERFEAGWVRWNIARAVVCTGAFGCLAWALVSYGRVTGA